MTPLAGLAGLLSRARALALVVLPPGTMRRPRPRPRSGTSVLARLAVGLLAVVAVVAAVTSCEWRTRALWWRWSWLCQHLEARLDIHSGSCASDGARERNRFSGFRAISFLESEKIDTTNKPRKREMKKHLEHTSFNKAH